MVLAIIIFFGFIGLALIILLITNKIASKYLNGDFVKLDDEEEEDDVFKIDFGVKTKDHYAKERSKETTRDVKTKETKKQKKVATKGQVNIQIELDDVALAPSRVPSEESSQNQAKGEVSVAFASYTKIKFTLEYNNETHVVTGCVTSVEDLPKLSGGLKTLEEICFHVKIIPTTRKYKTKTKWTTSSSSIVSLNFTLGPLKENIDINKSNICLRLYGKKKSRASTKAKCYGECFVALSEVTSAQGVLEFEQRILPTAKSTSESKRTLLLTDSELE